MINIIRPCFNLTLKKRPRRKEKKAVVTCLRSNRKDIFVEKKLTLSHFLDEKDDEYERCRRKEKKPSLSVCVQIRKIFS